MSKTKAPFLVFCANEQKVTEWNHLPDNNNEVLLQCASCGRFLKFPPGVSRGQLAKLIQKHEEQNKGEVKVEDTPTAPIVYSRQDPRPVQESFWEKVKSAFNVK